MQKSPFLEKNDFECIFERFEVLVVISGLADFEKHHTPAVLRMVDFLRISKITHF